MIDPADTAVLAALVIAPTVSPAPTIVVDATVCDSATTFGTAICGGPDEITRVTAVPRSTGVPAVGVWLITDPAGTVALAAAVVPPTASPTPAMALDAAVCDRPATFGTAICADAAALSATRISTAATFQRPLVGATSLIVAGVP